MKGLSFILAASFFLLTSSCTSFHDTESLHIDKEIKQVVFFSDEEDYKQEASYYDAIIELKKQFPDEIDKMMVIPANANKYYEVFEVEKSPAILVVYGDRVIARVNGTVTKDQIIEPLTAVLQTGN